MIQTEPLYHLGVAVFPRYWPLMHGYAVNDADLSTHIVDCVPITGVTLNDRQLYRIEPYDSRKCLHLNYER